MTLRRAGVGAQCSYYDFSVWKQKDLGPPSFDLDWCDILQKVYLSLTCMTSRIWHTSSQPLLTRHKEETEEVLR